MMTEPAAGVRITTVTRGNECWLFIWREGQERAVGEAVSAIISKPRPRPRKWWLTWNFVGLLTSGTLAGVAVGILINLLIYLLAR